MERGMRQYLEWELYIDPAMLKGFDHTFLFFFFHLVSPSQPLPPLFCCYFPGVKHQSSSFDREFLFFFSFDESFCHHSPSFSTDMHSSQHLNATTPCLVVDLVGGPTLHSKSSRGD